MSEGKRARLSFTQRTEILRRWKAGQSLHEIGRAYCKPHNSIRCWELRSLQSLVMYLITDIVG